MRRTNYLVIILLLIAQTSTAQVYQNMAQPGYKFGRARFDSVLTIPTGLGAMRNITGGQDTGQIRFNVSDSSVYVWNGRRWVRPVGGGVSDTLKVSVSDTAAMLANYAKSAAVALKVNISDTAAMLSPYVRAASLTIPTLTQVLEAAPGSNEAGANQIKDLSAGTSQNDAATFGQLTDTANLRLRISDTASMLSAYARSAAVTAALGLKLNISDTSAMLSRYLDTLQAHNTRIISAGGGGGSTGWALTGNASAVTDFLGTTNNRTMRFRTNNVERMVIDSVGKVFMSGDLNMLNNKIVFENTLNNTAPTMLNFINNGSGSGTGVAFDFSYGSKLALTFGNGFTFTHNGSAITTSIGNTGISTLGSLNSATNLTFTSSLPATIKSNGQASDAFTYIGGGSLLFQNFIGSYDTRLAVMRTTGNVIMQNGGTYTDVASSRLTVNSTTQGLLIPRMTLTQRNAIASPAAGLQVIVTGETGGEFVSMWNSTAAAWVNATSKWSTNANGINYNGGNVGIGTATPTFGLDVNGTARVNGQLDVISSAATSGTGLSMFGGTATITNSGGFRALNFTNGAINVTGGNAFIIQNNGITSLFSSAASSQVRLGSSSTHFAITNNANNKITIKPSLFRGDTPQFFDIESNDASPTFGQRSGTIRIFAGEQSGTNGHGYISLAHNGTAQRGTVAIGAATTHSSAILDVTSTTQGVLFPRMTTVQKLAIGSPAAGLQVYDTTLNQMSYFNGSSWVNF